MTIPKTWQEDYSNKLQKQVEELKAAHAAEQPKLTEEQAHAVVIDFWNKREMPQHPISSWESALVQFALLTSPVAPPPPASLVYEALVCAEYALTHPQSDQQFALKAIQSALTPSSVMCCFFCANFHTFESDKKCICSCHAPPPLAPGEQPPQACPSCERDYATLCTKCHNCSDCCGCLLAPHLHAPPAQERASDELPSGEPTQEELAAWSQPTFVAWYNEYAHWGSKEEAYEAWATAAKQAREERDNYWACERTRGFNAGRREGYAMALEEAAKVALTPISWKKQIPPNHGVANITVAGRYIAEAIRALAAQPSPQTKENVE